LEEPNHLLKQNRARDMLRPLSLRNKVVLIVLGAVVPFALLSVWLTGTAERSGEELLRRRLDTSLSQIVDEVGLRWLSQRSQLLQLAEHPTAQRALRESADAPELTDSAAVQALNSVMASMQDDVASAAFSDATGKPRWTLATGEEGSTPSVLTNPLFPVQLGIYDNSTGQRIGTIDARVRLSSLLPSGAGWGGVSGSVLAVFEPASGASLLPMSIDPVLFARESFVWGDEPWLTVRHELHEPPLRLALAAPLSPFSEPFQQAARRNLLIVAAVVVAVFVLATLLTRRTTRTLVRLAAAAEAVSSGQLDQRVEEVSGDEVGRVARAFNSMTESLQRTLSELSQRRALAAVGEFAASLAHEVRNPLTSIRLDLQQVEEKLPDDDVKVRELLGRALGEIERVDRSVTGALRVARSGSVRLQPVDVRQPLDAALHAAAPEFKSRSARLEPGVIPEQPIWVNGDSGALEQLFLNLLLNAAQSIDSGGSGRTTVEPGDGRVLISIRDSGRGIAAEDLEKVFDPFYSTRPEGTGLGLAIARRIALAHGGALEIESQPGAGTTVRVRLPLGAPPSA
jgi:signal transduction histidine kinase